MRRHSGTRRIGRTGTSANWPRPASAPPPTCRARTRAARISCTRSTASWSRRSATFRIRPEDDMTVLFLSMRALHVVCAALWLGSVAMLGLFVMPAIDRLGANAGTVMTNLQQTGLNAFMGSIGGLTILSGFYLYWHFTAGFDPTLSG